MSVADLLFPQQGRRVIDDMSAYGNVPDSLLDLREASQHPWMGITAVLNSRPYLVIGKDGNKFILEGEEGDVLSLLQFEWKDATENSRLVAASRQEGSALAKGSILGGYIVGNVRFHEGEWYVLQGVQSPKSSPIVPIASIVERLEVNRHDPRLISAEIRQAIRYDGEDYHCPECGSKEIDFQKGEHPEFDAHCKDCGYPGTIDDFLNELPDTGGEMGPDDFDWYPDFNYPLTETGKVAEDIASVISVTASTFEMHLPPNGIHLRTYHEFKQQALTATVHFPPLPGTSYEDGLVLNVPDDRQALQAMDYLDELEMAGGTPESITITVDAPDGQEDAVREVINRNGGSPGEIR